MKKIFKNFQSIILVSFLLIMWELYSRSNSSPVYFPPITDILERMLQLLTEKFYLEHISLTLFRCFVGFLLATIIAVPFGIFLGWNKATYKTFEFIIEFFRPLPSASIIPIAILFLGIDNEMKIFIVFFGSLWPILINTLDGVKDIEPQYLKTAKVFNINNFKVLIKIIFPSILPNIFTGLKISIAISLILAITVEMIVGGNGLGFFILDSERSFQFKEMYAGVFTIGGLGYLINLLIIKIEKWIIFWK